MSLYSNKKNNKYYYPPIGKVRNNHNIHLTDINNIKGYKIKKNLVNQNIPKNLIRNLHLNKSNSYTNYYNLNTKNDLYTQENTDSSLILNLKNRNNSRKEKSSYHDAESLYDINIQLKTEINKLKKELMQIKAENQRKENELLKKDKLLQNAFDKGIDENIEINNFLNNDNNNIFLEKDIKKNNYITKFKKQYNELKNKYNEKIEEIIEMKKNIKTTKINELIIQNKEAFREFNKLKELYTKLFEENNNNIEKLKKMTELENGLNEKNLIILQLQESLKLSSETNLKYENDIEKLKKNINKLQYENQILNNKLKALYEHYNKKNNSKEENNNNKFELNEELSLHPKKVKNGINFNNTNRSFINISHKINLNNRENNYNSNKRKILNISPISKNNFNESKDLTNNPKNNSINNNEINQMNKDFIQENEKIFNNNQDEENNNIKNNDNLEGNNNFNDLSQTKYILIKNFEVLKISREDALTLIIKPIINEISNEKHIKNETLVNIFTNKICSCLNIFNNKNDINAISNVINSLLSESNNELFSFIKSFLDIFDNVKIYEDNEEKEIIKRLNAVLIKHKEYFINTCNDEYISFFNFRTLLNNKNIILDDEDIEYLIYIMKKNCPNIIAKNKNNKENLSLNNEEIKNKEIDKNNENIINENNIVTNEINNNCSIFDLHYKTFLDIIK